MALLLTASTYGQSGTDPLHKRFPLHEGRVGIADSTLRRWASYRTTDRQNLSYCIGANQDLKEELRDHEAKDKAQAKDLRDVNEQKRHCEADNASKDITIMNQAAIIAPLTTWAIAGKIGTVAIGIGAALFVYQALRP